MKSNDSKIIVASKVFIDGAFLSGKALVYSDRIEEIIDVADCSDRELPIERWEGFLVPGFIDIHIHGANGADTMDATPEALETISKSLVKAGTTSYLATTMTMAIGDIQSAIDNVKSYRYRGGAQILGVHMEGPFISQEYKGAQDGAYIVPPSIEMVERNLPTIKMVTYAPEIDESFAFTKALAGKLVLSIGHTSADYDCAVAAFKSGATHVTHCCNAMTGLHHRKPGVLGAALSCDCSADFIVDGIHIHKGIVGTLIKAKAPDKRILITDAMRAAFLPEGEYELGGQAVTVKEGAVKLNDGTIAGSVLSTDVALKNVVEFTNMGLEEVVPMLTENPAKLLGIEKTKGRISLGMDADFVILSDALEVSATYVTGVKQW